VEDFALASKYKAELAAAEKRARLAVWASKKAAVERAEAVTSTENAGTLLTTTAEGQLKAAVPSTEEVALAQAAEGEQTDPASFTTSAPSADAATVTPPADEPAAAATPAPSADAATATPPAAETAARATLVSILDPATAMSIAIAGRGEDVTELFHEEVKSQVAVAFPFLQLDFFRCCTANSVLRA